MVVAEVEVVMVVVVLLLAVVVVVAMVMVVVEESVPPYPPKHKHREHRVRIHVPRESRAFPEHRRNLSLPLGNPRLFSKGERERKIHARHITGVRKEGIRVCCLRGTPGECNLMPDRSEFPGDRNKCRKRVLAPPNNG